MLHCDDTDLTKMHSCEAHINVPCVDHMVHVARITPLKYRISEDVVKVYGGKPDVTCEAKGADALTIARNTVVYDVGDVKMIKRWPLPYSSFEWFDAMDEITMKRITVQATHCVRVHIDAYLDAPSKTTIIWKLSKDDVHQEARVLSLVEKLEPDMLVAYKKSIEALRDAPVWRERS